MNTIPTHTQFFREPNIAEMSAEIAPDLARQFGGAILIGQVGCSNGQETWSMASTLRAADVDYEIEAFDLSEREIGRARGPYALPSARSLRKKQAESAYPEACLDYFDTSDNTAWIGVNVTPSIALQKHVTFELRDVLDKPLVIGRYAVAVTNNVLYHLEEPDRDAMATNIVDSVQAGGVVLVEDLVVGADPKDPYVRWRQALSDDYALIPINERPSGHPTIYRKI